MKNCYRLLLRGMSVSLNNNFWNDLTYFAMISTGIGIYIYICYIPKIKIVGKVDNQWLLPNCSGGSTYKL